MRVLVIGLRGFPDIQGGIEKHCEQLYPLLVGLGCDVEILVRTPYWSGDRGHTWRGVRFHSLWSPRSTSLETIVHSFIGTFYAAIKRPDILHIHAIGPALLTPLARLLGLRVVVTNHGPEYEREKWGKLARVVLRLGEWCGMYLANGRIAISDSIRNLVKRKYGREAVLIPNGVVLPEMPESTTVLQRFDLVAGQYVLMVGRIVPEKRHLDLIEAFRKADLRGWKLALVGAADHPSEYSGRLSIIAANTAGVVMTGFQMGTALSELYANAGIFALPSSYEGLPISLLEALSYGVSVLASDIPANLEIGLDEKRYFQLGNVDMLAERLRAQAAITVSDAEKENTRRWLAERYDWEDVARATYKVYQMALGST